MRIPCFMKKLAPVLFAFVALASKASADLTYSVVDLGVAADPHVGINDSGQVVGTLAVLFSPSHAFLFSSGRLTDLGTLPGCTNSSAHAINNSGQITGSSSPNNIVLPRMDSEPAHAFLYTDGVMKDLGTPSGFHSSYGYGINDKGQIAGYSIQGEGIKHAFLYSDGAFTDLGTLGGPNSIAYAINNSGQIAGTSDFDKTGFPHAFLYSNGVMHDLTTPDRPQSYGLAINDRGRIAGYSSYSANISFVNTDGIFHELVTLAGYRSMAYGINGYAQIVGTYYQDYRGAYRGFIYTNGRMLDLNTLVSPAVLKNWTITEAYAINNRGQIVASAISGGNTRTTLLLTPTVQGPIRFDYNLDGNADLLFQSQSNGSIAYETFQGLTPAKSNYLFRNVALEYKLVGAPDLNGDGKPDLLFQSQVDGSVVYALMNGLTPSGQYGTLLPGVPAGFAVAATPDLNGDFSPDIVLQNQAAGDIAYVFMNGLVPAASGYLFRGVDPNLKLVGTPDLNGDGHPDMLFENMKTGDVVYALMNGTTPLSYGTLFSGVSLEYQIVGTPDLNGDGHEDIVFQGQTTGDVSYVLLDHLTVTGSGYLLRGVNTDLKIVGVH